MVKRKNLIWAAVFAAVIAACLIFIFITVGDGSIWVSVADCSNQTCVHAGKISHAGQTVICAPHKLVIKIVGETSADAVI